MSLYVPLTVTGVDAPPTRNERLSAVALSIDGATLFTVTLSDDDTGTATATFTTTVSATGNMTGGGNVNEPGGGKKATVSHGFEVSVTVAGLTGGEVEYNDHRNGDKFHSTSITSVVLIDDPLLDPGSPEPNFDTAIVKGVGRLNGVDGVRFVMTVTDAGEPGVNDALSFVFPDGESAGITGVLSGGNHQARKP